MTTRPAGLAIGSTLGGKYEIRSVLGEGGMGAVYLAENRDIGRMVAIKVLHASLGRDAAVMNRFRQEARASAAIGHPGIVDVLDMGQTDDGEAFIVMERLEGDTLAARIKQRGRLGVGELTSIMIEVLGALAAAHAKGIVHRDLKPDNVFIVARPKWAVKILDFGISRIASPDEVRITSSNTVMGTVLYMPPEQARDPRTVGPAADLYALGAVMYQALSGRPPFLGETYTEVLSRVLTEPHESLRTRMPELPSALTTLVDQMLDKVAANRPASALAIRDQLRAIELAHQESIDPLAVTAPPVAHATIDPIGATAMPAPAQALAATLATVPPDVSRPARRSRARMLVPPLIAVLIAAVVYLAIWSQGSPATAPRQDATAPMPADAAAPAGSDAAVPDAQLVDAEPPVDARGTRPPVDGRPRAPVRVDARTATPMETVIDAPEEPGFRTPEAGH